MNDIEREIEGITEEEEIIDQNLNHNLNKKENNGKNKKIIIIIIIILFFTISASLIIYLLMRGNREEDKESDEPVSKEESNKEDNTTKLAYVDCDTNTSLLNVRNSPSGDIIDGLSCFQELVIEGESEATENCQKWYKISYQKHESKYTGYACSTYIKEKNIDASIVTIARDLIEKANDYRQNSTLKAYCGKSVTGSTKQITFDSNGTTMTGEYIKSEYKNLEELKSYLLSFLAEDIIDIKPELSDYKNPKYYDNYYEIDNSLYCRNYSGQGKFSNYTGNYNFEITNYTDSKIDVKIAYEYLKEEDDKCKLNNLSFCSNSKFEYSLGNITIKKNGESYIITSIDFYN